MGTVMKFIIEAANYIELHPTTAWLWRIRNEIEIPDHAASALDRFKMETGTWYGSDLDGDGEPSAWIEILKIVDSPNTTKGVLFQTYLDAYKHKDYSVEDRLWYEFSKRKDWPIWVERNFRERVLAFQPTRDTEKEREPQAGRRTIAIALQRSEYLDQGKPSTN